MSLLTPKKTAIMNDIGFGVCLWQLPDGSYLKNGQDYFCAQGKVNDTNVEYKMINIAREMGYTGKPMWLPGFRVISDLEWADQMERLIDGKTPDPVDIYHQSLEHA